MNAEVEVSIDLPGYRTLEEVYASSSTLVYRGIREADGLPVILKLLKAEYPTFQELLQFRNQLAIAQSLNAPNIIQAYSLESYGNSRFLVLEDFGGMALSQYVANSPLPLKEFLAIAIQLADILNILYHQRIVHKDIKPANILIHPQTQQVKLTDFSIASLLPKEVQEIQNPNILEGTLAYLSPEQTGRMNRGIDYKSDFYALGVTFFELLTQQLPFPTLDPVELVHCHIAKRPPSVRDLNSRIPPILSNLVSKLMAKNAEDRYQSALGLKHDLEECLDRLETTGKIAAFPLGQWDACDRFSIPEKLYGRQTEVQTLLNAFERIAAETNSQAELILVSGASGVGKTAVVSEVHKPIVRQRGYFIQGKFDQFQRNIPLSAFIQAVRDLMQQLLCETDAQLAYFAERIRDALAPSAQVIIEVIPELEGIIGEQPAVPPLSGTEAQNRFRLLFQKFIQVFTTPQHPLVIFLDDLQWADSASLSLIRLLVGEMQSGNLLVIGAYRDNEVEPTHPLAVTIEQLIGDAQNNPLVHQIALSALKATELNYLIADTLCQSPPKTKPLTEWVYQKTQGNPFFATQFLKALHEEGAIAFNLKTGLWEFDLEQIQLFAQADDVVEFTAKQLQKLPDIAQQVLQKAACIGNLFDLRTLSLVCQTSPGAIARDLWPALQEGWIQPQNDLYKFFYQASDLENCQDRALIRQCTYKFMHDRIQQAAYTLIPEADKLGVHLQIGQLLWQQSSEEERENQLFAIVNQLNIGSSLLQAQCDRVELAQLNERAARKAKRATAYSVAIDYACQGLQLLPASSWTTDYKLTRRLHEVAAEVAYLQGDFERMQGWIQAVQENAQTLLDRIKVYEIAILSHVAQRQLLEAIALGLEVLAQLDCPLPLSPTAEDSATAIAQLKAIPTQYRIAQFADLPVMTDANALAALRIANNISTSCYLAVPNLFLLIVLKQVQLSIRYGNTAISAVAYARAGIGLCGALNNIEAGYEFGQLALSVSEQFGDPTTHTRVSLIVGALTLPWKDPLRLGLPLLEAGYQTGLESGNAEAAALSHYYEIQSRYVLGEELAELDARIVAHRDRIGQIKQEVYFNLCQQLRQVVLNLMGKSENPVELIGADYDEGRSLSHYQRQNNLYALYCLHLHKLTLNYLFGDNTQALHHARQAERCLSGATAQPVVPLLYFYGALARLAIADTSPEPERSQLLAEVAQASAKLEHWASLAPSNFLHRFYLVEAERQRILDEHGDALEHYDRAIAYAKENQYQPDEALAYELAAQFYLNWGKERMAQNYLIDAYYSYTRWGAKAKVDALAARYPQLLAPILQTTRPLSKEPLSVSHKTVTSTSAGGASAALDFAAILKASQALSSEIQLEQLLSNLLQVTIENAGADKGVLLLLEDGQWRVEGVAQIGEAAQVLQSVPLEESQEIPLSLINQVKRQPQPIAINNATEHSFFLGDAYIQQAQPKSLLCNPIWHQGKLVGMLYLENRLTAGVFTSDRTQVLNLLCAQAAISLENARLYQRSQQTLEELKQAQQLLRLVIDNIPQWIFWKDRNSVYLGCNQSFAEISGAGSPAQILGKTDDDLKGLAIEKSLYRQCDASVIATGQPILDLVETKSPADGQPIWLQTHKLPLRDPQGEIVGVLGTIENITKRIQAEQLLKQQKDDLAAALQELQQTQFKLIQSDKMSALGNLVAGVAHEINNPVGFIAGNLKPANEYMRDLFGLVDLYQKYYPNPVSVIQEEIDNIDLGYLKADFPELLNSMELGVERICNISNSLRTFSRADKDYKVPFNIHEGLDSTLLILKHRLKAHDERPAIEIIKKYGSLPTVNCFPGQLNQVFMNLLANAVDALEELYNSDLPSRHQADRYQIEVDTQMIEDRAIAIRIADRGIGMAEAVKQRAFDHLFTTKPVGQGTGLGLAIARQIVVEVHGGTIQLESIRGEGTAFTITLPLAAD
ncbi:AAA family ATPase [Oscillatoria amoena NRMC-F 0135]|nr:AAA family ATPase [Geitlerinema splendidum]MDL5045659.1 AAA family ATPase [Oscillatoria amoena NRMC-F 0135]